MPDRQNNQKNMPQSEVNCDKSKFITTRIKIAFNREF